MKKNDKGEMYEYCMKQSCCKICPKLERCPFDERNKEKQEIDKKEKIKNRKYGDSDDGRFFIALISKNYL